MSNSSIEMLPVYIRHELQSEEKKQQRGKSSRIKKHQRNVSKLIFCDEDALLMMEQDESEADKKGRELRHGDSDA